MNWDHGLTSEQRIAASHFGSSGRMLAGPGTGKTLVLTRRIQYLIQEKGVDPQEILALTFTRFAAYELRNRVADALGFSTQPKISTLHSFALRQLIKNSKSLDVLQKPLRVADDWEEKSIIFPALKNTLGLRDITEVEKLFNNLSADWELNRDAEMNCPNPRFIGAWKEHRKVYGYTMRSELVYQLKRSLEQIPDFQLDNPIKHLLVDEYQDLNPCDLAVIKVVANRGAELFVAGDDDQSIYGFRNAYPEGIRQFPDEFKNSTDLPLRECKRCDPDILKIGEFVAKLDPRRIDKGTYSNKLKNPGLVKLLYFVNETNEAQGITTIIEHLHNSNDLPFGEFLVLLRVDTHGAYSSVLCDAFQERSLPFNNNSEDVNPLNQPAGREFLSFLRISKNHEDQLAWRTLLGVRHNNIGDVIISSIYDIAYSNGISFIQALRLIDENPQRIPRFGERVKNEIIEITAIVNNLITLIDNISRPDSQLSFEQSINELVNFIIHEEATKKNIVNHIFECVNKAPTISVREVIDNLLDTSTKEEPQLDPNKINILTMHKAKGLSSSVVFIIAAEDEHIPGKQFSEPSLGDERRLLFVSLTRAKHYLFVSYSQSRLGQQKMLGKRPGDPSRHLSQFLVDGPIHPESGNEFITSISIKR